MEISRRVAIGRIGAASSILLLRPGTALAQRRRTPNVVVGPFYPLIKPAEQDSDLSMLEGSRARGTLIEVSGSLFDLGGNPVPRANIEIWQANAAGRYAHPADTNRAPLDPNFQGFGQLQTDRHGRYRLLTVKPGPYPTLDGGMRAPHVHFEIRSRQSRLVTQMLFPGEALNATDRVTSNVNRTALVAKSLGVSANVHRYEWNIIVDLA